MMAFICNAIHLWYAFWKAPHVFVSALEPGQLKNKKQKKQEMIEEEKLSDQHCNLKV